MLTHLLIMRHAKSDWGNPDLGDHARPLNARGQASADAVGRVLSARGYAPELIWASDAVRTHETAKHLMRVIPGAQSCLKIPDFYLASADAVMKTAEAMGEPDGIERLMWLGHNPGWATLFGYFSGRQHAVPTGACLVLKRRTPQNWLRAENWRPVDLILPRDIMSDLPRD